jgi:hypothetical protein
VSALAFIVVGGMNGISLLSAYLVRSWKWQGVMALAISSPIVAFFHFSWWILVAMLVSMACIWVGLMTTTHDVVSRVAVRPWATLAAGSSAMVLGTITSLALIVGNQVFSVQQSPEQRVDRLINGSAVAIEQVLLKQLPGVTASMTINQAIRSQLPTAESLLENIGITETLSPQQESQLTKEVQNAFGITQGFQAGQTKAQLVKELDAVIFQYENQSIDEIRKQISDRVGISLRGTETVHQALREAIAFRVQSPALRYASFFGIAAAAAAWLLLRIFSPFFAWAAVLAGAFWFWFLRFIRRIGVNTRVEEIQHLDWRN